MEVAVKFIILITCAWCYSYIIRIIMSADKVPVCNFQQWWEWELHCHSYTLFCLQREVLIVQWVLLLWTPLQISTVI